MKETGILFTPDNIRAIMEGRKTQTRRVMEVQPESDWHPEVGICAYEQENGEPGPDFFGAGDENECYRSRYSSPGDHLYIKEGHNPTRLNPATCRVLHGWMPGHRALGEAPNGHVHAEVGSEDVAERLPMCASSECRI